MVRDTFKDNRPAEYVRTKLGHFGLSGELAEKRMVFLSGGQKSRVAFTALTWNNPHFIIMDEPTNHLDVETSEGLINAIKNWPGGIFCVSHDQFFKCYFKTFGHCQKIWHNTNIYYIGGS